MGLTTYLENALLNHCFPTTETFASPSATYLGLFTVAPTDSTPGTEVTVTNGYAREQVSTWTNAAGGTVSNATPDPVEFQASGGNWGDIVAVGIFDASVGGNLLWYGSVSTFTVNDTDTVQFDAGEIQVSLD